MSERSDKVLLEDMLEAVDRILEYTAGYSPEAFGKDKKTIDAVLRNLQVLGEAAKQVSDVTKKANPEVEWSKIIRSRHVIVHEYFGVDLEIIWRIIQAHLTPVKIGLEQALQNAQ